MAAVLRRAPLPTDNGGGDAAANRAAVHAGSAAADATADSGAADDAQLRRTCLLMPSRATLLAPGTLSLGLLRRAALDTSSTHCIYSSIDCTHYTHCTC